jgi:C_GCAxxG_C_C family probable redox protein
MSGEMCGAVSGAVLVLGLKYGAEDAEIVTHLSGELVNRFAEKNGAVRCQDIIGFNIGSIDKAADFNSIKGVLKFGMRGGKVMCKGIVSSAVEIVMDEIEEWET